LHRFQERELELIPFEGEREKEGGREGGKQGGEGRKGEERRGERWLSGVF
jgi:hypothetical protein